MKGFYFYNNVKSFLLMQGKKKKERARFYMQLKHSQRYTPGYREKST